MLKGKKKIRRSRTALSYGGSIVLHVKNEVEGDGVGLGSFRLLSRLSSIMMVDSVLSHASLCCAGFSISDIQSRDVLDLIESLNQTGGTATGFQYTSGPNNKTPAILLEGKHASTCFSSRPFSPFFTAARLPNPTPSVVCL